MTLYGTPALGERRQRGELGADVDDDASLPSRGTSRERYPYVHLWAIWNEPNQRRWLRPTTPRDVRQKLLNPAYAAIHRSSPGAQVAGGVTAPRGSTGGVSPVAWIAGMAAAHAQLDAYAHNPYPLRPGETPIERRLRPLRRRSRWRRSRACSPTCSARSASHTRIWLTEYGYQTNPPDRLLGVSYATQAQYVSEAALRAYLAPRVDMLIQYLVEDEPDPARWQSGVVHRRRPCEAGAAGAALPVHGAVADRPAHDAVGPGAAGRSARRTGCSSSMTAAGCASAPTRARARAAI